MPEGSKNILMIDLYDVFLVGCCVSCNQMSKYVTSNLFIVVCRPTCFILFYNICVL